jgi:hypothetical protein
LELHPGGQQELTLDEVTRMAKVDVDQLYGIEIGEWPARIAEVAIWLMDHLMNQELSAAFGQLYQRLPLRKSAKIIVGNALRIDWNTVLAAKECTYILGNPPFVGKHLLTADQESDMHLVWGELKGAGFLDYVTGWYRKAAEYIAGSRISVAFVSTNSITLGEQVGILWNELLQRWHLKIHFAHRTFAWESEARGAAHVHVVIVGFGAFDADRKLLYDHEGGDQHMVISEVRNISPYLVEGPDMALPIRREPLCEVPEIIYGNKPADGGFLIVADEDRFAFLRENPGAAPYLRPFLSAEEYLNGKLRWVLWLVDAPPKVISSNPGLRARVQGVRDFRSASTKASTRRGADYPALFDQIRQPTSRYLVIPCHSSEKRKYVPFGYFDPDIIIGNSCTAIPNASLYHVGVISSIMHMAWMKQVCGRLESRYRYSNKLVYNNYPWPEEVTDAQKAKVEECAQTVLNARQPFIDAGQTLADLYDPLTMPSALVKAHQALDRAVDRCYRKDPFENDRQRVEFLFSLYQKLTAPLIPAGKPLRRRKN